VYDELRVGLIGYSLAGASFHAPFIAATPGLRLTAIVTANPERRAQAQQQYPGVELIDSADALWDLKPSLDLVVVASPNRLHAAHTLAAVNAGCHVVVDKPMARSAEEARTMAEAAAQRGRMLTVFHNRRWDGDFLTLRKLLQSGELGEPLRFESRFERWRPEIKPVWRESSDAAEAGGVLFDLGPHLIDQALVLFGAVTDLYAEVERRRPTAQVDDHAFLALTHKSGVRSHLYVSLVTAQAGPRMCVLGSKAGYTKFGMDVQETPLRSGQAHPNAPDWGVEPREAWGYIGAGDDVRAVRTEVGNYRYFYDGVVAALRSGAAPPVDPADAIAGLEIIEAAHRFAQNKEGPIARPLFSV
jgi:predicted dehydrogenase